MSRFILGDCVRVMATFPGNAVDFILTDPPYLVGFRDRSGRTIDHFAGKPQALAALTHRPDTLRHISPGNVTDLGQPGLAACQRYQVFFQFQWCASGVIELMGHGFQAHGIEYLGAGVGAIGGRTGHGEQ